VIEIKDVTKTYGKKDTRFTALRDIHFAVESESTLAIVGRSGSGKSTLMHIMSGLDTPDGGHVVIDGEDILTFPTKRMDAFRARKIGFIFQSFFVSGNETCAQNIALPLEIADVKKSQRASLVDDALKQVGLFDKKNEKAKNLSGGQKQRLAIARAIVNKPAIIFADEPTGNLDSKTGDVIEDLLFSLHEKHGATLIIVTHDQTLAARCDTQLFIRDGVIERSVQSKKAKRGSVK
jgi:putative ABC transport system ATP-binding protein